MIIPEIKHILYTTDMSEEARYALGYAISLATRFDARLTVLHVVEGLSSGTMALIASYVGDQQVEKILAKKEEEVMKAMEQRLTAFCRETQKNLSACDVLIRRGNPVEQILEVADSGNYDLVVMGTRGLGTFKGALMGSTARRVLRHCQKPVLVVRIPARSQQ